MIGPVAMLEICSASGEIFRSRASRASERYSKSSASVTDCRLDIHNGCSVDGLDGPHAKPAALDGTHDDRVQTERVGSVRRSCREHAGQRIAHFRSRVHLERLAPGSVEPADDDDLISNREAPQPIRRPRVNLEPGVRRAFGPLPRCLASILQHRSEDANGLQSGSRRRSGLLSRVHPADYSVSTPDVERQVQRGDGPFDSISSMRARARAGDPSSSSSA